MFVHPVAVFHGSWNHLGNEFVARLVTLDGMGGTWPASRGDLLELDNAIQTRVAFVGSNHQCDVWAGRFCYRLEIIYWSVYFNNHPFA